MPVVEPHKELRFTRAAQAVPFWVLAAMAVMATIVIIVVSFYRAENPDLPHPAWATLPLIIAGIAIRIALHCTRRAYLIFSPLGLEIFPLLKPIAGMQLIPWTQIHDAEIDNSHITLHFSPDKSSGIHLTLSPIPKTTRPLLKKALQGRLNNQ